MQKAKRRAQGCYGISSLHLRGASWDPMGSIAPVTTLEGQLSISGNRGHLPRWDGAGQGSLSPVEQEELVQRRTRAGEALS